MDGSFKGQGTAVTQAHGAHAARDWPAAVEAFDGVPGDELSADDLVAYFEAVWWVGRSDDALRIGSSAYEALLDESRPVEAVKTALWLGVWHLSRGDEPGASGWWGRARRLAEEIPEHPVHGYLILFTEVQANMARGSLVEAIDAARRAADMGRRFDDPDLLAAGLNSEGRALLKSGRVVDGLALIDEAMITIQEGETSALWTGNIYCLTIEACHEVSEIRRLARWTEMTEKWLEALSSAVILSAMCRVHRAQLQLLRGDWDGAEVAAAQVADQLGGDRVDYIAEAWYLVGEVRRLRGDPTAGDAYKEAHLRGRDPQPGRALLRLQEGDGAGAMASIRSALTAAGTDPLRRAPLCAAAVEIALAEGRLEEAKESESELLATAATYATSGLEAMAATARGTVLLAEGQAEATLPVLLEAYRSWIDLGADYTAAGISQSLAEAYRMLGDEASAAAEEVRATATYERMGVVRQPDRALPAGLTEREWQVLAKVTEGKSNRDIGGELFISDRTVARHLTNIFHKIGVANRTEAARYALDHRIGDASR